MKSRWHRESGAALMTVLVMLAVLSTLAIVVTDLARFSLRRTSNQMQMDQARWYLMGAESYAASRIADLRQRTDSPIDQEDWQGRPLPYPLDDGLMTITIWDGGNCFNLNSVVERTEDNTLFASARGQLQFARLLDLLDIHVEGGLSASLADWIDTDQRPVVGGGEDEAYRDKPYRPPNTLIADVSELRQVRGFAPEIIAKIAPFVCVRPNEAASVLNVNALRSEQAPLLAMVVPGLTLDSAREIIRSRPHGGWRTIDAFFQQLIGLELAEAVRSQFGITSSYYVMRARVQRAEFSESSEALIVMNETRGRVLRRLFGVAGPGRIL